jgi:hypothetical protein
VYAIQRQRNGSQTENIEEHTVHVVPPSQAAIFFLKEKLPGLFFKKE